MGNINRDGVPSGFCLFAPKDSLQITGRCFLRIVSLIVAIDLRVVVRRQAGSEHLSTSISPQLALSHCLKQSTWHPLTRHTNPRPRLLTADLQSWTVTKRGQQMFLNRKSNEEECGIVPTTKQLHSPRKRAVKYLRDRYGKNTRCFTTVLELFGPRLSHVHSLPFRPHVGHLTGTAGFQSQPNDSSPSVSQVGPAK